jgi:hypothetical protein
MRAVLTICWRQGIWRSTRFQFWRQLFSILRHNRGVFVQYLSNCALLEHFIQYRQTVRDEIEAQIAEFLAGEVNLKTETPSATPAVPNVYSPAVSTTTAN